MRCNQTTYSELLRWRAFSACCPTTYFTLLDQSDEALSTVCGNFPRQLRRKSAVRTYEQMFVYTGVSTTVEARRERVPLLPEKGKLSAVACFAQKRKRACAS